MKRTIHVGLMLAIFAPLSIFAAKTTITDLDYSKQTVQIDCSGSMNSIQNCYKRAQAICPDGFREIANTDAVPSDPGARLGKQLSRIVVNAIPMVPVDSRQLTVACTGRMDKNQVLQ